MKLIPKTKAEMARFFNLSIEDYAQGLSKSYDLTIDAGRERADSEINRSFKKKKENELMKIVSVHEESDNTELGGIWYVVDTKEQEAYIYQIMIYEKFRGKGYGKTSLDQFHQLCKAEGLKKVCLSVFGWNNLAFKMYEKAGYEIARIEMKKFL